MGERSGHSWGEVEVELQFSVLQRLFPKEAQIRLWCLQRLVFVDWEVVVLELELVWGPQWVK